MIEDLKEFTQTGGNMESFIWYLIVVLVVIALFVYIRRNT